MKIDDLTAGQKNGIAMDGTFVRYGTIGTMMRNVDLVESNKVAGKRVQLLREVITDIVELIPSLKVLGLFEFFNIMEWLQDSKREGRILVALLYLKQFPEKLTDKVRERLSELARVVAPDIMDIIKD